MTGATRSGRQSDHVDQQVTSSTTSTQQATSSTTAQQVTTSTGPGTTRSTATTRKCGTVGFTPASEDAASDITATGLSCREAEAFVLVAGHQTSAGGPEEVTVEGYRCVRARAEEDPLPRSFYECTNGTRKVTFVCS